MQYNERPADHTPIHTTDLPPTPVRDRNIMATAWIEAPASLLTLGDDLPGQPTAEYKRRIGPWILWRAGPAKHGDARYWAAHTDDLTLRSPCASSLTAQHKVPAPAVSNTIASGPGKKTFGTTTDGQHPVPYDHR